MKLKLVIILFIINFKPVSSDLITGFNLLYSFRLDKLEEFADSSVNSDLKNFFLSYANLWKYLGSGKEEYLLNYKKYDEKLIDFQESGLNLSLAEKYLLDGYKYMNRALLNSNQNEMLSAFSNINKALGNFENALEEDSSITDAYVQMAAIKYSLGFTPGFYGTILKIFGLKGSLEETIGYLKKACRSSKFNNNFAYYYLSKLYIDEFEDVEISEDYLNKINDFSNPVFQYQRAVVEFKKGNFNEAVKLLDSILILSKDYHKQIKAVAHFLKGDIYFNKFDFVIAEKEYQQFINETTKLDYIAYARLRAGLSAFFVGDRLKGEHHFSMIKLADDNVPEDKYSRYFLSEYENADENEKLNLLSGEKFLLSFFNKNFSSVEEIIRTEKGISSQNQIKIFEAAKEYLTGNFDKSRDIINKIDFENLSQRDKLFTNYLLIKLQQKSLDVSRFEELLEESIALAEEIEDTRFRTKLMKIRRTIN